MIYTIRQKIQPLKYNLIEIQAKYKLYLVTTMDPAGYIIEIRKMRGFNIFFAGMFIVYGFMLSSCDDDAVDTSPCVFTTQASDSNNCLSTPQNSVCVRFTDNYIWIIEGAIDGTTAFQCGKIIIEVVEQNTTQYQHVLDTDLVRIVDDSDACGCDGI